MSMDFFLLVCTFPLQNALAVELSVCSGVGGCLCPSSSSIILKCIRPLLPWCKALQVLLLSLMSWRVLWCVLCSTLTHYYVVLLTRLTRKNVLLPGFSPAVCFSSLRRCGRQVSWRSRCMWLLLPPEFLGNLIIAASVAFFLLLVVMTGIQWHW